MYSTNSIRRFVWNAPPRSGFLLEIMPEKMVPEPPFREYFDVSDLCQGLEDKAKLNWKRMQSNSFFILSDPKNNGRKLIEPQETSKLITVMHNWSKSVLNNLEKLSGEQLTRALCRYHQYLAAFVDVCLIVWKEFHPDIPCTLENGKRMVLEYPIQK